MVVSGGSNSTKRGNFFFSLLRSVFFVSCLDFSFSLLNIILMFVFFQSHLCSQKLYGLKIYRYYIITLVEVFPSNLSVLVFSDHNEGQN